MKLFRWAALACAVLTVFPAVSHAQTTGSISGQVIDQHSAPIAGATVTVVGPQGTQTVKTDRAGYFTVPYLTPGSYTVKVESNGFKTAERTDQLVSLGQTLNLQTKLEVAAIAETIHVSGTTPTVDSTQTTTGTVIHSDFTKNIPVGRRISDVAYLAPAVSSSGTVGSANPSMAGGSGLDNLYVIDGVNVTNTGYGAIGSYSVIFGSLGLQTPFDFVEEFQLKTGGYQAEFGQSAGGVINVITKSGTNMFSGSAFVYSSPSGTQAAWKQYQSTNGTVQTLGTQQSDAGVEVGGPIVRDHLFFFGAVDPQWSTTTLQAPDGFALRSLGGVDRKRQSTPYSAKATYVLDRNNRFEASFFGDPSTGDNGPQRTSAMTGVDTAAYSSLTFGGHNQTVRYQGIRGNWLLQASYAHALNRIIETPSIDTWSIQDQTVTPNIISGGVGFYEAGNRSVNHQLAGDASNVFGAHQVKYGVDFSDVTYSQINQRTGPTFLAPDGRQTATGAEITILPDPTFGKIYRVTRANYNTGRVTTQRYLALYLQDTWKVGSNLTITPGLRYEQQTLNGTLVSGFTLKNNWAPRVGVAWDPTHNGLTRIYGNYGRYFARIPNDLAARALSADDGISRADYFDANLTNPIPNGVVTTTPDGTVTTVHYQVAGVGADTIDPNAKLSYIDEGVMGFQREIATNMSVGVSYTYRRIGRVLEDVANVPMVAYDLGVPGIGSVEYILTNPSKNTPLFPGTEFLGASFDTPIHVYQAVEVTLARRMSNHWSAMASYRWSRLKGNFEGFYRDDNGQSDPGITSLYDFPTNDPSYTAIGGSQFGYKGDIRFLGQNGILPLDRPHQVKLSGAYTWTNFNIGMNLQLGSGKPLTPLTAHPIYSNGGEIPTAARGTGIQSVDGFVTRTPFQSQLDVQASYKFGLSKGHQNLTVVADMFNVFNEKRTLDYDTWTDLSFGVPNPDFGKPISQIVSGPQFQAPFSVRFGVRWAF